MPDFPTSIRLNKDLKVFLQKAAKDARRPLSQQIVHILEQWRAYYRSKGSKQ